MSISVLTIIKSIFGEGLGILADHFKNKRKLEEAKVEAAIEIEKIKVKHGAKIVEDRLAHEIDWDIVQAKNAGDSLKDEVITYSWLALLALHFIPWTQPYMEQGWDAISYAPDYFEYVLLTIVSAAFGIRETLRLADRFGRRKPKTGLPAPLVPIERSELPEIK